MKMMKKEDIERILSENENYKDRYYNIGTEILDPNVVKKRGDIKKWADETTKKVFGKSLKDMETPAHFSYIKFAKDKMGNAYGIVGGKSQFHKKYTSDICFYKLTNNSKKKAAKKMVDENLEWFTDSVIIVKNKKDQSSSDEAFENESDLQKIFDLFG